MNDKAYFINNINGAWLKLVVYNYNLLFMEKIDKIYIYTLIFLCPAAGRAFHPDVHRDETKKSSQNNRRPLPTGPTGTRQFWQASALYAFD